MSWRSPALFCHEKKSIFCSPIVHKNLSPVKEILHSCPVQYGSHDPQVATASEELVSFYSFSIHFNLSSHTCIIDFISHSTVLGGPQQDVHKPPLHVLFRTDGDDVCSMCLKFGRFHLVFPWSYDACLKKKTHSCTRLSPSIKTRKKKNEKRKK